MLVFNFDFKAQYIFDPEDIEFNNSLKDKMRQFMKKLIESIQDTKEAKSMPKNKIILILILLLFSEYFSLDEPIMKDIVDLILQLCLASSTDLNNIARTFVFHIFNRLQKNK